MLSRNHVKGRAREAVVSSLLGNGYRTAASVAIAAALILGPSSSYAQPPRPAGQGTPAGNVQNGKNIFTSQKCGTCHGSDGQGGSGQTAEPQIGPPRLALAMFVQVVRNPRDPCRPFPPKTFPTRTWRIFTPF